MNEPLTVATLARSAWHDFCHARRVLFLYDFGFKLLEFWLIVPLLTVALAIILSQAGHLAVSNLDILDFLLTPSGLLYATVIGTITVALLLYEQAGIMLLVALAGNGERPPFRTMLRAAVPKMLRVIQLGAVQLGLWALALVPFGLLTVLTFVYYLSEHDIYFYLKTRPPVFWQAVSIGAVLLLAALVVSVWLFVRWAFALPILLFENQTVSGALRASRERVRGIRWRVALLLVGWFLGIVLLGTLLEAGFQFLAATILKVSGERPVVVILLLLLGQGILVSTVTFFLVVGLGLITRRMYLLRSEQLGFVKPDGWEKAPDLDTPASPWNWWLFWLSFPLFLVAPLLLWINLSRYLPDRPPMQVTAHRGNARVAPENTLPAIRKAIESGADYVEMDAQLTSDGVVVLLHDRDLKRVAGVSRRLDEMTFDEVRQLDVGKWFDPAFTGERVPTLVEAIALCRGRARLNIELKFFGSDRRLIGEVVRILEKEDVASDCLITCLNYDALMEVKKLHPEQRIGLTVAHALGDISRLEVDALSVRVDHLSDSLLHDAQRRGREVHVWTINEASQMIWQMKRGVNNLITSDPESAVRVRDEWAELSRIERLLLASRLLLGLEP